MKKILGITVLFAAALVAGNGFCAEVGKPAAKLFELEIPQSEYQTYKGPSKADFPNGIPIGVGSGLTFYKSESDGTLLFYTVSDRGPNANTPLYVDDNGKKFPTKAFLIPENSPRLGIISVKGTSAQLLPGTIPFKNVQGKPVTGLPRPKGMVGYTGEAPLDDALKILPYDADGIDPEGVDIDASGHVWICDESGPFIMKVDSKTGIVEKTYAPGRELPEFLTKRQPNRGFEGIAVTKSGKVLAAIQSILDVDGKLKKSKAAFIPLVWLDPVSGAVKTFAYQHDLNAYKASKDAKLGDLATIDENRFLIVEQGTDKDKKMRNLVYEIDLSGATDISKKTAPDGKPLETLDKACLSAAGVVPVKKKLVVDLRACGWTAEKAEGLAIVDNHTIAVCSDNDFGVLESVDGKVLDECTVNTSGQIVKDGKPTNIPYKVHLTGEKSQFMILTLPETL